MNNRKTPRDSRAFISSDEEEYRQKKPFSSLIFKGDDEIKVGEQKIGQNLMEKYGFGHVKMLKEEIRRSRSGSRENTRRHKSSLRSRSRSRERKEQYYKRTEPKAEKSASGGESQSSENEEFGPSIPDNFVENLQE